MKRWFARLRRRLTPADVRFFHLWILGREPTQDDCAAIHASRLTSFSLARRLFASEDFSAGILSALEAGVSLPHEWLPAEARKAVATSLQRHFGIRLAEGTSWARLIAGSLAADKARHAFVSALGKEVLASTLARLEVHDDAAPATLARIETISGYTVRGWAVALDDPDRTPVLDFFLNGAYLATASPDRIRRDLQDIHGGHGRFGFELTVIPPRKLEGSPVLRLTVRDRQFGLPVVPDTIIRRDDLTVIGHMQRLATAAEKMALAGIVPEEGTLGRLLGHIRDALPHVTQFRRFPLANYDLYAALYRPQLLVGGDASRIAVLPVGEEIDWAALTQAAGEMDADWVMPLHARDELETGGLAHLAAATGCQPDALVLYPDHDHISSDGRHSAPRLFAAFDHDLLLSRNDSGRALLVRREFLARQEGLTSGQDLMLRAFEEGGAAALAPAPGIAWHLGTPPQAEADAAAVAAHLARTGRKASVRPHSDAFGGLLEGCLDIDWEADPAQPKLAIIIPTRNGLDLVRPCVESLHRTLRHPEHTEIIIVDNGSDDPAALAWLDAAASKGDIRLIRDDRPFNWSALNNAAAQATDADYLLFLNNDTLALTDGWDETLRGYLARPEVGIVGARLLYEDGTIQHAGVIFHSVVDGAQEGTGDTCDDGLYLDRTRRPHRTLAVFGAFLACRREVFDCTGGFDEGNLGIGYSDYEICFKAWAAGFATLYVPALTLSHFESKSRGYDAQDRAKSAREEAERDHIRAKWGPSFRGDPWYPSLFAREGKAFQAIEAPIQSRE